MAPWDHNPAFTSARLTDVAQLIARGRNTALDRFDTSVGCSNWTVGCEAFQFQRFEIMSAADKLEWLGIVDPSMQFVFSIGDVPVRFYRGEPTDPTKRTLKESYPELLQMSLFRDDELLSAGNKRFRFAVETDIDGSITQMSFVVLSGETPISVWPIEIENSFGKIAPLWPEQAEGVELPPPPVGLPKTKVVKGANDA